MSVIRRCFSFVLSGFILCLSLPAQKNTIWFDTPNPSHVKPAWMRAQDHRDMVSEVSGSSKNTDADWEERSIPVGNGNIGANIMGGIAVERFTLNEISLWRGGPNTPGGADYYWKVNKESAHVLKEIREAFRAGDVQKATRLTCTNFNSTVPYEADAEQHFRFGSYTTLGELRFKTDLVENDYSEYRRALSVDSAVATVSFVQKGVRYTRRTFASHPDNVLVTEFSASQKGKQSFTLEYTPNPVSEGTFTRTDKNALLYHARLNNNGMQYAVRIRVINKGGTLAYEDGTYTVKNADRVLVIFTADTDYRMNFDPDFSDPKTYVGINPQETTQRTMTRVKHDDFAKLLATHIADYKSLYDRVTIRLGEETPASVAALPTPVRLANYRKGEKDHALETLYYQFGRYLLISSSRAGNLPANLQGLWANNIDAPWRSDYHLNINLQMNYWLALSTALTECQQPLTDYIRTLVKPGRVTARAYFGARGWTASISGNIFGFTSPLRSENMSWNFNPMAGPWLATHLWEYYDYTRDRKYLREIYSVIAESADFTTDYLWKRPDGIYTASPSTSPEHGPIDEGATFCHAVAREILCDAIEASKCLDVDADKRAQWQEVLEHLASYRIGRYGQLMEWSKDIDDPKDQHRHVNHLFGLHPGKSLSPLTTPELAKAAHVVLVHRGDGATGWSMGWKLNQWARLHDGNHAYTLYQNLLKNGTLDNLWDTHPPFQIDGNFGGTAGVTEMLLQSHAGVIHLLPALPDAWASGEVKGLVARGNFSIDIAWKNKVVIALTIRSHSGGECRLLYGNQRLNFVTEAGKSYSLKIKEGQISH